jgi:hypothetical protein
MQHVHHDGQGSCCMVITCGTSTIWSDQVASDPQWIWCSHKHASACMMQCLCDLSAKDCFAEGSAHAWQHWLACRIGAAMQEVGRYVGRCPTQTSRQTYIRSFNNCLYTCNICFSNHDDCSASIINELPAYPCLHIMLAFHSIAFSYRLYNSMSIVGWRLHIQ